MNWEQSATVGAIGAALADAQTKIGHAIKDSTNPHFKSQYADLASVREAAAPLADHGIAVVQQPYSTPEGEIGVRTMLLHKSGEWIATWCAVRPAKLDAQGAGSVITYLRRYTLAAVAGIAQADDDGNQASGRAEVRTPPKAQPAAPGDLVSPADVAKIRDAVLLLIPGDGTQSQLARASWVAWAVGRKVDSLSKLTKLEGSVALAKAKAGETPDDTEAA